MSELHYRSLMNVSAAIRRGALSPVEVTQAMLDRIEQLDTTLHAFATVSAEQALTAARRAEDEIRRGLDRGPLHGIPVAVKDLCFTKDAPTGAGMPIFRDWIPDYDATVVERLKLAGAVMLGKLTMTEGATLFHHPDIPAPVNPWHADYWSGASSSGSGVATAAGLCFASLGSDTGGSIRMPSASCGLTGIKPTWGRVSLHGIFPLAQSFDHIGPMARSAEDAAAILSVISGADENDPTALLEPVPDYLREISLSIRGIRIGIDWSYVSEGTEEAVIAALRNAATALASVGAEIVDIAFPSPAAAMALGRVLTGAEIAENHIATYPARKDQYGRSLAKIIEAGRALMAADIVRAQKERWAFCGRLASLFRNIDLILVPVLQTTVPLIEATTASGWMNRAPHFTMPFNLSGNPSITLTGGYDSSNLPIAFQLVGPHLSESLLCRAGHAFQQVTDWHTLHPSL